MIKRIAERYAPPVFENESRIEMVSIPDGIVTDGTWAAVSGANESFAIASDAPLFRFPYYQTQEKARAAGLAVPEYSTNRPVKSWVDPNPPAPDEDGFVSYLMIATTHMGCGDVALTNADGKPYLRRYKMTPGEARTLNIPPKGDFPDKPQPKGEWNFPCRELLPNEYFVFGFGGVPELRDKPPAVAVTSPAATGDSTIILGRLEEIDAKLDILLSKAK